MALNVHLLDNPVLKYRENSTVPVNIAAVARRIDALIGNGDGPYYVPFAAVNAELATAHNISGDGDLYGGIVQSPHHADKAILHTLATEDAEHPEWYSTEFAQSVSDVVLLGYTVFSQEDAVSAFRLMSEKSLCVRLKDPANTGGLGQHLIRSVADLYNALSMYGDRLSQTGIVLEVDLHNHATITIGHVDIHGDRYSWYGRPYDVQHEGAMRFGGNELTVTRGDIGSLFEQSTGPEEHLAIEQSMRVFQAYDLLGAKVSRITLDVVQGTTCRGMFVSGVTDPSLRPSASSAAEVRALEEFAAVPDAKMVKTKLQYDYEKHFTQSDTKELFLDHSRLNILVEVVDVIRS